MPKQPLKVVLATPRGFCAGVERAIEIVERALDMYGAPVYVRHEIVHNKRVVDTLRAKGARFVEEIDEVPEGAITIFSAHGVSKKVEAGAGERGLKVIDATCPLVSRVHKEGQRYVAKGYEVVLIGHKGHPEVEGTMGQINEGVYLVETISDVEALAPKNPERLSYVTQTTLSVDDTRGIIEALKKRFPGVVGPDVKDICYATQNRQTAVRALASEADVILVVGASNSSNSNRLRELAEIEGVASYLIQDPAYLKPDWLKGARVVGVTAGASAPEDLVQEVIGKLAEWYDIELGVQHGIEENVQFKLPAELNEPVPQATGAAH